MPKQRPEARNGVNTQTRATATKIISALKPINESDLETAISYEQLAVDLTAILARHVKDDYVKNALNFALLEDFDHLYRYANLLESELGIDANTLTGGYTEITPGRPTVAEPRHPYDEINRRIVKELADPLPSSLFPLLRLPNSKP